MKLRVVIIAALLAVMLGAPAYAADKTYYTDPQILNDDRGIVVQIDHVKVSDMPTGYSVFNYPPSQYQFYTVYYMISNPTDQRIRFQFNLTFVDDQGRMYTSEEYNLAEWLNPNDRSTMQPKEFAVYRNATGLHLQWAYIDHYWNTENTTKIALVEELKPTATATPTTTATPAPAATPTATPSPTPASGKQPCLPFLPMAVLAGGFGTAGLLLNRIAGRR